MSHELGAQNRKRKFDSLDLQQDLGPMNPNWIYARSSDSYSLSNRTPDSRSSYFASLGVRRPWPPGTPR
jgi:hypothetical protein